jgi:hypothetical protein
MNLRTSPDAATAATVAIQAASGQGKLTYVGEDSLRGFLTLFRPFYMHESSSFRNMRTMIRRHVVHAPARARALVAPHRTSKERRFDRFAAQHVRLTRRSQVRILPGPSRPGSSARR